MPITHYLRTDVWITTTANAERILQLGGPDNSKCLPARK